MTTLLQPEQIRTASLYPLATLEERTAGTGRVLVTHYWPRGVKREHITLWWPSYAPGRELLARVKTHEIGWDEFAIAYRQEMSGIDFSSLLAHVLARYGAITLLCHEHDAPEDTVRCHRRLLREILLEQAGAR